MIHLTQLVYVRPGKAEAFHAFEDAVLPLLAKHHGELRLRIRPPQESVLAGQDEPPYEVHILQFESEEDLTRFSNDPVRQQVLHLKEESVSRTLLIKGQAV